jgi:hypothetical protein
MELLNAHMMTLLCNPTLVSVNNDKRFFLKDKKEMKEQLIKKKKTILLRERKNENICPYAVLKWLVVPTAPASRTKSRRTSGESGFTVSLITDTFL